MLKGGRWLVMVGHALRLWHPGETPFTFLRLLSAAVLPQHAPKPCV